MDYLSSGDLLAGGNINHDIDIPRSVLYPELDAEILGKTAEPATVKLQPLSISTVQQINKAAKDNNSLVSVLLIKESLVEPKLNLDQINKMHAGLAQFLLREINKISGLEVEPETLSEAVQEPLAKACFLLAKEFGWSHKEISELTMGQILIYLEMAGQQMPQAEPQAG